MFVHDAARLSRVGSIACLAILAMSWGARSQTADDVAKRDIVSALEHWRLDFNARESKIICDLFATELLYDFQGLPEQNYEQLCARLRGALADRSRTFHYDLMLKEVLLAGDLAIVRLTWISTLTTSDGESEAQEEPGLDVFRRQSDGSWKIIRYIAYPATRQ
jgi:ketosteroid isomerase-like protein